MLNKAFAPSFVEHSPLVSGDRSGLAEFVTEYGDSLAYTPHRVLGNNQFVALHGRFDGIDGESYVGFDIYRVEDSFIAEHWDGLVPLAAPNPSGRTQLDDPTEQDDSFGNEAVEFVEKFFDDFLIDQNYANVGEYTANDDFT